MKNHHYEVRQSRPWKRMATGKNVVTRKAIVRALSTPDRSRSEVSAIVSKYMGDSSVPPSWSLASVRGTFGKKVARRWARHIRGLRPARYKHEGRWLFPQVQTSYDFGLSPDELAAKLANPPSISPSKHIPLIVDEAHMLFSGE